MSQTELDESLRGRAEPAPAPPAPTREPFPGLPERIHLVGVGGAGVSGAARLLWEHGHRVSAEDRSRSEHVDLVERLGIQVALPDERARSVPEDAELVVRSAAVPDGAPAIEQARERGISVLKYGELLGHIMPAGRTLAVAGTHGKTTTSWMVHHALAGIADVARERRGRVRVPAPGALVGGVCRVLDTNAVAGEREGWFAVEACEYDRTFLQLAPRGAIVTNVEADHLDYYGSLDAILGAFARFADRVHPEGLIVMERDVPRRVEEAARCAVWRVGRELDVGLLSESQGRFAFRLRGPGFEVPRVELSVPGEFNVDNAALALGLVIGIATSDSGLEPAVAAEAAARGLERFQGSRRRFEPWGTVGGIDVVHDYAHHPTEVRVTLETARRALSGRPLHVLFQPHQHSRTARFFDEFVESLRFADRIVVSDVYGARAHVDGEPMAGAPELVRALQAAGVEAVHAPSLFEAVEAFAAGLPDPAAALVLGAGDVDGIQDELLERLALRRAPRG